MQYKILIAEDNIEISDIMRNYLLKNDYTVYQAFNGKQTVDMVNTLNPDLLLLDVMMPKMDGFEVCKILRQNNKLPIIISSAIVAEEDKVRLFELGADDYITKPFSYKEMVMRVAAQLRRYYEFNKANEGGTRVYGNLSISPEIYEVKVDNALIALTAKEFKILDVLTRDVNHIFSKQKLIDTVWGYNEYIDENTVAVTIARLREKLAKHNIINVVTVWGLGYKWQE